MQPHESFLLSAGVSRSVCSPHPASSPLPPFWQGKLAAGTTRGCVLPCRQERLREAADAEARAKQLELEAQVGGT